MANVEAGGASIADHVSSLLDPFGRLLGLDGVILLAFIIAIPANEIALPTALMLYMQQGWMVELDGPVLGAVLSAHGWTVLTAISLMLFSLLHNPCGTTIWTILAGDTKCAMDHVRCADATDNCDPRLCDRCTSCPAFLDSVTSDCAQA